VVKLKRLRWAGNVKKTNVNSISVVKPTGGTERRWEDNIEMDVKDIGVRV
jgi:hypothetical protein